MGKFLAVAVLLVILFFVFISMNNPSNTLSKVDALARLKSQVGSFNEKDAFISRLNNTDAEEKAGTFIAELISCDKVELFDEGNGIRAGSEQKIHQAKMCWVFTWKNMLTGGYDAYIDGHTGELLCVKQIIEG